jgi:DNA-binding beta-propeller fold protein YncE
LYGVEPAPQFDVFRLSDTTVVRRVTLPRPGSVAAVSPDGKELYVGISNPNVLQVYRLTDPSNPVLDRTIPLVGSPQVIAVDRRGAFIAILSATSPPTLELIR